MWNLPVLLDTNWLVFLCMLLLCRWRLIIVSIAQIEVNVIVPILISIIHLLITSIVLVPLLKSIFGFCNCRDRLLYFNWCCRGGCLCGIVVLGVPKVQCQIAIQDQALG